LDNLLRVDREETRRNADMYDARMGLKSRRRRSELEPRRQPVYAYPHVEEDDDDDALPVMDVDSFEEIDDNSLTINFR